jgi:hypothetical protein
MRTITEIQLDLSRCYNAIAEVTQGNRVNKFTFSSAESQQSYEMLNPTLAELEKYRDSLIDELNIVSSLDTSTTPVFAKSYFQTRYSKFD